MGGAPRNNPKKSSGQCNATSNSLNTYILYCFLKLLCKHIKECLSRN